METKEHHFTIEDAKKYGIKEAVILYNLKFWLDKNLANRKNIYKHANGKYYVWTYNSTRAYQELFPYLSEDQIKRILKKLKEDGILLTGNFNKIKYDRTLWYSLKEYKTQKSPIHLPKSHDGTNEIAQPIPDNKPDIKQRKNKDISSLNRKEDSNISPPFDALAYIQKMKKDKNLHIRIIATYLDLKSKGKFIKTKENMDRIMRRNLRVAQALAGYDKKTIETAIEKTIRSSKKNGFRWTLETALKLIET